jgi:hypothetical protein
MARRRSERADEGSQGSLDGAEQEATGAEDAAGAADAAAPGSAQEGEETGGSRRGGRGGVAAETYTAVERLTREEGLSRSEAFARLGAESDRRPATVAAAYYRAARQRGQGRAGRAPSTPRRSARPAGRPRAGDAERLLQSAIGALTELTDLVRRQQEELLRLRADEERYREIRALIEGARPARRGRPRSS